MDSSEHPQLEQVKKPNPIMTDIMQFAGHFTKYIPAKCRHETETTRKSGQESTKVPISIYLLLLSERVDKSSQLVTKNSLQLVLSKAGIVSNINRTCAPSAYEARLTKPAMVASSISIDD